MTKMRLLLMAAMVMTAAQAAEQVVQPVVTTAPLYNYEDAPATPDADDPAIWVNQRDRGRSLVIGTAKDAGVLVYDLNGRLLQALLPPDAPQVLPEDPDTPAGENPAADRPCPDSDEGETFGRYNNVDIAYDLPLTNRNGGPHADVAVVSDRGCDRVRFFRIDPDDPEGPLVDVTAPDVPRVFHERYDQPSAVQPSGDPEGWRDNPVDDQNTVYGLTVAQGDTDDVFVTQRERGLVKQLRIIATADRKLTYRQVRSFLFDTSFDLRDELGDAYMWTPCREAVQEEPQSEGLVFDAANRVLYVALETIGLYRLPLTGTLPELVRIGVDRLIEPITSFGRPYVATLDDDEFQCEYDGDPSDADVVAPGAANNAGEFLAADLEGLSIVESRPGRILMLASSQGDSSFHFYELTPAQTQHVSTFLVDGVGETDGVHVVASPLGRRFPRGLLVVQNGDAPPPDDTGDVNGFELDGSTQFKFVDFRDVMVALSR